jgi:hypothetical protein
MAKEQRLYSAEDGAYMTRLSLSSFRTKVSKLGIKGTKQGAKVFYTHGQIEDIHSGVPAGTEKAAKATAKPKATKKPAGKASGRRS